MKNNNSTLRRNSFSFTTMLIGAVLLSGFYLYRENNTRQYSSGIKTTEEKEQGAQGMIQYFFNARKSMATGKMDYASMAAANAQADLLQQANSRTSRTMSTPLGMSWTCMGPSATGGRTRAILVDNQDPTHQTLWACAVSGGIWKSTDGGQLWDSVPGNDQLASLNAVCIAEDANGVLYVGTGEGINIVAPGDGFSGGMIGGGIFKSTDHGLTWNVLPNTKPTPNTTVGWAYVNRIAIDPNNANNIYAATQGGVMYSGNAGNTWGSMHKTANHAQTLGTSAYDVKISKDGKLLLAFTNGRVWYAYPSPLGSLDTLMGQLPATLHDGGIYSGGVSRVEIAIAPSNSDYAYLSVIGNNEIFGSGASVGTGIFFTKTAVSSGNGGYWYEIGPGGSNTLDPYSSGGLQDQAAYDNTLGVNPLKPGNVLVGGTIMYTWHQANPNDTVGAWTDLTYYYGWPHPDEHAITFDPVDTNIVYNGNDGGVYKSFNGGHLFVPMNRNYNVTQFNAISFAPYMSAVPAGFSVGEGVMGGTQDNGTPYIGGAQVYYEDAVDLSGGDGGKSAISQVAPNVFFVTSDFASLSRGGSLATLGFPNNFYNSTIGDTLGANIDSMRSVAQGNGGLCFYHTIALYENSYQTTKNLNTMLWISDTTHLAGTFVYPVSPNGLVPFPYQLPSTVHKGDSLIIQNPVVSKLAVGFSGANGVWLTCQAIDLTDIAVWMPIGGPKSLPDPFTTNAAIHTMAFSPDGDALFVGTEGGDIFRFTNLDSIVDKRFSTGALWGEHRGTGGQVLNLKCRVKSKNMGNFGQDVLSISVDPQNGDHVMFTLGNYGATNYVYYCDSAITGVVPTFHPVQGSGVNALPKMPVYSCVLDVQNSGQPKSALVGTERGIYSTKDITVGSPTWGYETTGGPNTLIQAMAQQTLPPWNCNNSYNVYVGSHGRGAWVSTTFFKPLGVQPVVADVTAEEGLKVYPNPMTFEGKVEFNLPTEGNVTITVYDLSGRELKNIEAGNQSKGLHTININAEDLSTGTYIATVTGNNYHKSARFVVVK